MSTRLLVKSSSIPGQKVFDHGKKFPFPSMLCTRCCRMGVSTERIIGVAGDVEWLCLDCKHGTPKLPTEGSNG